VITAPNLNLPWLTHGFGLRDSLPPPALTTAQQIHSARILDACGRKGEQIGEGDAIISSEPGVAIGIRTADCVPILLADTRTRVVACVHAGWRGTAANIAGATVEALVSRGCQARNLCVAIGPSIGSCCYEVGSEVACQFDQRRSNDEILTLDLAGINETQLMKAGVKEIWKSGECTYCHADRFFSFRREKEKAGRMLSFINRVA
jgi:YfiH family protein